MIPATELDMLYSAADGFTVAASFGGETTQVHFRQSDEPRLGERIVAEYTLRYRASTLAALARGSTVTIGGAAYKVLETPVRTPSGDERIARLSKV